MEIGVIKISDILKIIGGRIKQFRKSKKLSQEELAFMASVDPTHLGRVERGESNCSIEMLDKLLKA
ncbi:helix-turn-helix domain-containing protein [Vallitalea maricola]|uniref:Uncharacterized protein n=1 Tax=Vallitalea maricola TaxID=3074433 RepID=A0ACB5UGX0_9FIRM|nr:hypothetical protein AN2V17_10070 [Vallitalea sp. AN17-2]